MWNIIARAGKILDNIVWPIWPFLTTIILLNFQQAAESSRAPLKIDWTFNKLLIFESSSVSLKVDQIGPAGNGNQF